MKISDVILQLTDIWRENGDIEVGMHSGEFDVYSEIKSVFARNRIDGDWPDDMELGSRYAAISYGTECHTSIWQQ